MPPSRHVTWTAAALTGVAVAVTVGCSRPAETPDAVGPASAYVDLVLDVTAEAAEQRAMRYEEVVAACMAEAGFEYLPSISGHFFVYDESTQEDPPGSREFAEQYGYGNASRPDSMTSTSSFGDNPNDALIATMSESEADEYYLALYGTWFEDYLAAGSPEGFEGDWTRSGCDGRATHEVSRAGAESDATYLALKDEIDRIEAEVVPTHPDVVAADAEWSECMADAGFPGYARQPDARASFNEHFTASGGGGGVVGPDGMTPGQAELIQEETALATVDWDCIDEVGYDDVVARVSNAAQQEFVDAHRDELDAWVQRWAEDTP